MKAQSVGKNRKRPACRQAGFSTLEMMIAFAIMSLVLGGVVLANFGAQYWVITSQTSNEGLYKAKTRLEQLRGLSKQDFYGTVSSPLTRDDDAYCLSGSLCYYLESVVVDLSTCSKYAQAKVVWQVQNYPTTTTSLFTQLSNPAEALLLGGDCPLNAPKGDWSATPSVFFSSDFTPGNPTGLDVLDGLAYESTDQPPYFKIAPSSGFVAFANAFSGSEVYNGLDSARDAATGRTYTYAAVASTTSQLQVIDVTDRDNPTREGVASLSGVSSIDGKGWRIAYYDRKVYIATLFTGQPDLHVFDVSNPTLPSELGSVTLGATVNSIVIRDQVVASTTHRFAYLATTNDSKEVIIVDVTNPASIGTPKILDLPDTGCSLANKPDATTLALSGNDLWVGRERSPSCTSLGGLYRIDVSNPSSPSIVSAPSVSATVVGVRVSGPFAFVETSTLATASATNLLDIDDHYVYAARSSSGAVQIWSTDPSNFVQLSSYSLGSSRLQVIKSP